MTRGVSFFSFYVSNRVIFDSTKIYSYLIMRRNISTTDSSFSYAFSLLPVTNEVFNRDVH